MTSGFLVAAFACAFAAAGCSSSAEGAGAVQSLNLVSASGAYHVAVRTESGATPARGENVIELDVTDGTSGAPVTGLTVTMVPWMPAMGHGASVTPAVADEGGGRYVATNVDLFMPGTWELRTTLTGATTDHVTPQFQIQ
jgi:hypothetical protein